MKVDLKNLNLEEEHIVALRRGGYLHDLGKIGVPDEILKKGTNLTAAEWEIMKKHPLTGEAMTFRSPLPAQLRALVAGRGSSL